MEVLWNSTQSSKEQESIWCSLIDYVIVAGIRNETTTMLDFVKDQLIFGINFQTCKPFTTFVSTSTNAAARITNCFGKCYDTLHGRNVLWP